MIEQPGKPIMTARAIALGSLVPVVYGSRGCSNRQPYFNE